jgi:MFS family permease
MTLNAPVAVISSALLAFADAFLLPAIVIAAVTSRLTADLTTVGLAVSLAGGLWYLPQVLATGVIQHRRQVKPVILLGGTLRAAALGLFAYIGFRAEDFSQNELLRWFLFALVVATVASAFTMPPLNALAMRAIRPEQRRHVFAARALLSLILAVFAGLIVARVFGSDGPGFPRSLTLIVLAAAASVAAGTFLAGLIREPKRVQPVAAPSLGEGIRGALTQLRFGPFRRFLLYRTLVAVTAGFDPLIILYGFDRLGVPSAYIGYYVVAYAAARLVSDPFWAWLGRASGHRALLQATTALRAFALGAALAVPTLAESDFWRENISRADAPAMAFGLCFALLGAASSGLVRGSFGYLTETVPQANRFYASSLVNAVLMVAAFAPIVIFSLAEERGLDDLLTAGALLTLVALLMSGLLTNSIATVRNPSALAPTRIGRQGTVR